MTQVWSSLGFVRSVQVYSKSALCAGNQLFQLFSKRGNIYGRLAFFSSQIFFCCLCIAEKKSIICIPQDLFLIFTTNYLKFENGEHSKFQRKNRGNGKNISGGGCQIVFEFKIKTNGET